MPASRSQLFLQREFTAPEYERIRCGFVPEAMEDKWFIFLEDDALYIHRSWTGVCIYQLTLSQSDDVYAIESAVVNRDESQYSGSSDGYDEQLVMFLIDSLLLGRPGALPLPGGVPADIATGLYHHHVIGAGPRADLGRSESISLSSLGRWLWAWLGWLIRS